MGCQPAGQHHIQKLRSPGVCTLRESPLVLSSGEWQHFQMAGDQSDHNEFADGQQKEKKREMAKRSLRGDLMGSLDDLRFKLYHIHESRGL